MPNIFDATHLIPLAMLAIILGVFGRHLWRFHRRARLGRLLEAQLKSDPPTTRAEPLAMIKKRLGS